MGFTYVEGLVHGSRGSGVIRMLVDTGSTCIVLNPSLVEELGLYEILCTVELMLDDRRRVKSRLYVAEVEAKSRRGLFSWLN